MSAETGSIPSQEDAARRAAEAEATYWIVIPAAPWGGSITTAFGPMTESEARERLAVWVPLHMPTGPPKLLRVVEDYG